jgi:2-oxoglutarate dehydrogenase E1 component
MLRRQALRLWRKPLVVLTPKSLLRAAAACSTLSDLSGDRFHAVISDGAAAGDAGAESERAAAADRLLVASGKVAHELMAERARRNERTTAIVRIEQLYPFPEKEVETVIERHAATREIVWVQEEPANMGALTFILPRLERVAGGRRVTSVKRSPSASPATGSFKAHAIEQKALLELAFARLG